MELLDASPWRACYTPPQHHAHLLITAVNRHALLTTVNKGVPTAPHHNSATLVISIVVYSDNIIQYSDRHRRRIAKVFFLLPPPFNDSMVESFDASIQQIDPSLQDIHRLEW